ncbi:hypothetical protein DFH11DRAFT_1549892 [Phellopilus nigrolimitatus]|nr:hypothetical protein DFH11DRAFT_1549892 [Phellopilus nigrolimitatus]
MVTAGGRCGTTLVVALASWLFNIYGVRRMGAPMQKRESSFKFLTRALGCMVDGQGYSYYEEEKRKAALLPKQRERARNSTLSVHSRRVLDLNQKQGDSVHAENRVKWRAKAKTVRFYDVAANEQKCKFDHRAPVPDCCFSPDGRRAFSGELDTSVREFDLETETFRHLGQHSCLAHVLLQARQFQTRSSPAPGTVRNICSSLINRIAIREAVRRRSRLEPIELDVVDGAWEVETQQVRRVGKRRERQCGQGLGVLSVASGKHEAEGKALGGACTHRSDGPVVFCSCVRFSWLRRDEQVGGPDMAASGNSGGGRLRAPCRRARVIHFRTAGGSGYGALGAGGCRAVEMESSCASAAFASVALTAAEPQHPIRKRKYTTTHQDNAERVAGALGRYARGVSRRVEVSAAGGAEHVRFGRRGGGEAVNVGEGGDGPVDVDEVITDSDSWGRDDFILESQRFSQLRNASWASRIFVDKNLLYPTSEKL